MSALEASLPADDGNGVTSILQDLSRIKHATDHVIALAISATLKFSACTRHIILALDKIRNELSKIWSATLSKFAHVERNTLVTTVVIL